MKHRVMVLSPESAELLEQAGVSGWVCADALDDDDPEPIVVHLTGYIAEVETETLN